VIADTDFLRVVTLQILAAATLNLEVKFWRSSNGSFTSANVKQAEARD
jgi:hypothetical protein